MATLTPGNALPAYVDVRHRIASYRNNVDANNTEANKFTLTFPTNSPWQEFRVLQITVQTINAQTAVLGSETIAPVLYHQRGDQVIGRYLMSPTKSIRISAGTTLNAWQSTLDPLMMIARPLDNLEFDLPPGDTGGAPTVDYEYTIRGLMLSNERFESFPSPV